MRSLVPIFQPLESLIQLFDANNQIGNRVEKPVEDQSCGDQEDVALTLHDGLLVAEVLGGGARLAFTAGASLVLPVDVHEQE